MKIIVETGYGHFNALDIDTFKKDYPSAGVPKCQGDKFYIIQMDKTAHMQISESPNPACMYINGEFQYIIYTGGMTIINGVQMPPAELIPERSVFPSREAAQRMIDKYEEKIRGRVTHIDCPDGRRIVMVDPKEILNGII